MPCVTSVGETGSSLEPPSVYQTMGDGASPFELDGEDAGDAPVTFSVKPRALRVIVRGDNHA